MHTVHTDVNIVMIVSSAVVLNWVGLVVIFLGTLPFVLVIDSEVAGTFR